MRKDPAVLFYYEAFSHGTQFLTDEEAGKYIRLLIYQFDKGHIPLELVLRICKASGFENISKNILSKLKIDENGHYFNERADIEKEKRIKFTASRKANASTSSALAEHDINKDISINISKLLLNEIIKRKPDFKQPDINRWAEMIELMVRVDKRSVEEIKKVIIWCQQDSFWRNNILSTFKLRKQFDQLSLKMQEAQNGNKQTTYTRGRRSEPELSDEANAAIEKVQQLAAKIGAADNPQKTTR
jgi:hypothetical protein